MDYHCYSNPESDPARNLEERDSTFHSHCSRTVALNVEALFFAQRSARCCHNWNMSATTETDSPSWTSCYSWNCAYCDALRLTRTDSTASQRTRILANVSSLYRFDRRLWDGLLYWCCYYCWCDCCCYCCFVRNLSWLSARLVRCRGHWSDCDWVVCWWMDRAGGNVWMRMDSL